MLAKSCPDHHDPAVVEAMLRWHTGVLPPALEHTVSEAEAGERLTRIAGQRFAQLGTKSQAENAVKRGALLVNNEEVEKARKVKLGDTLTFQPPTAAVPPSAAAPLAATRLHAIRGCNASSPAAATLQR